MELYQKNILRGIALIHEGLGLIDDAVEDAQDSYGRDLLEIMGDGVLQPVLKMKEHFHLEESR